MTEQAEEKRISLSFIKKEGGVTNARCKHVDTRTRRPAPVHQGLLVPGGTWYSYLLVPTRIPASAARTRVYSTVLVPVQPVGITLSRPRGKTLARARMRRRHLVTRVRL